MSNENSHKLVEKIADLIQNESQYNDVSGLRTSIEKINKRLDSIENRITADNPQFAIRDPQSTHPSQQKYDVIEAIVDEVLGNTAEEKACTFEPNGKPCDHCSMCSSHGF